MSTSTISRTRVVVAPVDTTSRRARIEHSIAVVLSRYSITLLRIALGVVFLGFGALKLIPGASPAEDIAIRTTETLTLHLLTGGAALLTVAVMEIVIGLSLLSGLFLRVGLAVMAVAMVGIVSPLVLFTGDLFPGGHVTLMAQYVVKDFVLVAAGLVIAATTLGARFAVPAER